MNATPTGNVPSAYQPNPADDRQLGGPDAETYRALAAAIEECQSIRESEYEPRAKVLQAVRSAESALRRAAWLTVAYHEVE